MIRSLALAAVLALAACATSPPSYVAAPTSAAEGYSELQIESNRYFVTFRAPGGAEVSVLQDYALLRAAELTQANGHEWFWVDRRTMEGPSRRGGSSIGIGAGGGSYGGSGGGGVGVGINIPIGGGSQVARAATLEIRFGEGPKPDDANAYNASSTASSLRARIGG
jgi:hypothetical protein